MISYTPANSRVEWNRKQNSPACFRSVDSLYNFLVDLCNFFPDVQVEKKADGKIITKKTNLRKYKTGTPAMQIHIYVQSFVLFRHKEGSFKAFWTHKYLYKYQLKRIYFLFSSFWRSLRMRLGRTYRYIRNAFIRNIHRVS